MIFRTGNSGRDQQISTGHAFCTKTKITRSSGRSTTTAIRQRHRGTFEAHRGTFEGHRGTFEGHRGTFEGIDRWSESMRGRKQEC